jgi:hypothetical protein
VTPNPGNSLKRTIAALLCAFVIIAALPAQAPGLYAGPFKGTNGVFFADLPATQCGGASSCQQVNLIYPEIAAQVAPNLTHAGFAQQLIGAQPVGQSCKIGQFAVSGQALYFCDVVPYWTDQFGTPIGLWVQH